MASSWRPTSKLVEGRHLYSLLLDNASYEVVLDPEVEGPQPV